MEHYAPCHRRRPSCCCRRPSTAPTRSALAERLALEVGPRARRSASCSTASTGGSGPRSAEAHLGAAASADPPRGGRAATAHRVQAASRYLLSDIPAGPVRRRLAEVLEERALLPLARVRLQHALAVCNDDAKTVVRLTVEQLRRWPTAAAASRSRPGCGHAGARLRRGVRAGGAGVRQGSASTPRTARCSTTPSPPRAGIPAACRPSRGWRWRKGSRAGRAAGLVLPRLADIAEANLPGTLEDLDTEFLHDLRVSIRRARSVLRELKDVFEPGARPRARRAPMGPGGHRAGARPRRAAAGVG